MESENTCLWDDLKLPVKKSTIRSFNPTYKRWVTMWDEKVSDKCFENELDWWIRYNDKFSSWVSTPPWHINCRCILMTSEEDKKPELTKEEKWDIVLKLALRIFKDKGKKMYKLWHPTFLESIINTNSIHVIKTKFALEILFWDSNIKKNSDFYKYSHNKPDVYFLWKQVWGEVIIDWIPVYLADIWNLLYWYLWQRIWFEYNTIIEWANIETSTKTDDIENNEKDDRVFYELWYNLAENTKDSELTLNTLKETLINWTNRANEIRRNKDN